MRRARLWVSGLVSIGLITVWCLAVSPDQVVAAPELTRVAPETVYLKADSDSLGSLVNEERQAHSLPPLTLDQSLCEVARNHAADMIKTGYFGHVSPTGATPSTRLSRAGISFRKTGENLAGHTSVTKAHGMLMTSAAHRGNILNPEFHKMGIAVVSGGPYGMMIVEVFVADAEARLNVGPAPRTP